MNGAKLIGIVSGGDGASSAVRMYLFRGKGYATEVRFGEAPNGGDYIVLHDEFGDNANLDEFGDPTHPVSDEIRDLLVAIRCCDSRHPVCYKPGKQAGRRGDAGSPSLSSTGENMIATNSRADTNCSRKCYANRGVFIAFQRVSGTRYEKKPSGFKHRKEF
jgi:hypothetical protein